MSDADKAWHASFKPHFTPEGKLIVKSGNINLDDKVWEGSAIARSHNRTIVLDGMKPHEPLSITDLTQHAAVYLSETGVPEIDYTPLPFDIHASTLAPTAPSVQSQLYNLLHILFDTYDDSFTAGLSDSVREDFADRIRKDRLSAFLSGLIAQNDTTDLAALEQRKPLEAALRYLARGDAVKSSDLLYSTGNPTVALLVAQAPNAGAEFQAAIGQQISNWREQSALSEMDVHIRALYELLAGNTTISRGMDGPVEHKAATFSVSSLLGLNWLNMFALNLWFGTHKSATLSEIITTFTSQLASEEETASPVSALSDNSDPLWIALQLYASTTGHVRAPAFPQALSALSGAPSDLNDLPLLTAHHALVSALPAEVQLDIDDDAADQLAASVAAQCEARADVPAAVWALLHLADSHARGEAIVELLLRNAARLPTEAPAPKQQQQQGESSSGSEGWATLTDALALPVEWLYQALALRMRAEPGDRSDEELRYLVLADEGDMAHRCLVERVAPRLVIDEDWEGLRDALRLFGGAHGKEKGEPVPRPEGWREGGEVFEDFLGLVSGQPPTTAEGDEGKQQLVGRLSQSLARMARDVNGSAAATVAATAAATGAAGTAAVVGGADEGIVQVRRRVAVREMARWVVEHGHVGGREVLVGELPLTGEIKGRLGRELASRYYAAVMSGGRA